MNIRNISYDIEHSPEAIILCGEDRIIHAINNVALSLFGYKNRKYIEGNSLSTLLPIALRNHRHSRNSNYNHKEQRKGLSHRAMTGICNDGQKKKFITSITEIVQDSNFFNLIQLREVEDNMLSYDVEPSKQRLQILSDLAPIAIIQVDHNWNCVYSNNTFCDLSGLNIEEISGRGWIKSVHLSDSSEVLTQLRAAILENREYNSEFRIQTPLGKIHWVHCIARPLFGQNYRVTGYLCTLKDISVQREAQKNLEQLAHYDPLTGLANRSLFNQRLEHACLRAERHDSLALFYLDIDKFKIINDSMGHQYGDEVLKQVASKLKSCLRKEDTIARLGGDEFVIILEDMVNTDQAGNIARNIIEAFKHPVEIYNKPIYITCSIGIAMTTSSNVDPDTLINNADSAMYAAKRMGRNTMAFSSDDQKLKSSARMTLGNELHTALENKQFHIRYQPQIDSRNGHIFGMEALIRWDHPTHGFIAPDKFIPVLEDMGMIQSVFDWLLSQTLIQHKEWHLNACNNNLPFHISVNVSPKQIWRNDVLSSIESAISSHRVDPGTLTIEITETALISDTDKALHVLHQLKDSGFKVALDDFGTGYSSLSYLKDFPIDFLKIDRSFVRNILTNKRDMAITSSVIDLAHTLDIEVIAEGVDSFEKYNYLHSAGCDYMQGYYFSPAVPAQDFPWNNTWNIDKTLTLD